MIKFPNNWNKSKTLDSTECDWVYLPFVLWFETRVSFLICGHLSCFPSPSCRYFLVAVGLFNWTFGDTHTVRHLYRLPQPLCVCVWLLKSKTIPRLRSHMHVPSSVMKLVYILTSFVYITFFFKCVHKVSLMKGLTAQMINSFSYKFPYFTFSRAKDTWR